MRNGFVLRTPLEFSPLQSGHKRRRRSRSRSPRERRLRSRSRSRSDSRDRARRRDKRTWRSDKKRQRGRDSSSSSSSASSSSSDDDEVYTRRKKKKKASKQKKHGKRDRDSKLLQAIRQTPSEPSSSLNPRRSTGKDGKTLPIPTAAGAPVSFLSFMKPLSTGYDGDRANNSNQFYRGWTGHNALAKDEPRKKALTRLEILAKEQDSD
ncbi:hypothetical protein FI667_g8468, partial [Globisporangium splendens]